MPSSSVHRYDQRRASQLSNEKNIQAICDKQMASKYLISTWDCADGEGSRSVRRAIHQMATWRTQWIGRKVCNFRWSSLGARIWIFEFGWFADCCVRESCLLHSSFQSNIMFVSERSFSRLFARRQLDISTCTRRERELRTIIIVRPRGHQKQKKRWSRNVDD